MKVMNEELVSVIITTYNRSLYLNECLLSVSNQTYKNIEILVIDDGSNKENALINKNICSKYSNCNYLYKENTGQPDSRNYGILRSNGEFFSFCDDDDFFGVR